MKEVEDDDFWCIFVYVPPVCEAGSHINTMFQILSGDIFVGGWTTHSELPNKSHAGNKSTAVKIHTQRDSALHEIEDLNFVNQ